ncbi:MAG TPA: DUF6264 family protein [Galbitalea sp.]|jgi:hypothetical protein|nr:DUF6264 family protein [Galbitalea sp.]
MTDDRPRPEYGEYATPEQQAAAMGRPYISPVEHAATEQAAREAMSQVVVARPTGYANRFFTVFLLGLGILTLIERIPTYFSYASSFKGSLAATQFASIKVPSSLDGAGVPTLIANIVLLVATAIVSIWVLRRGHASFYIPIIGAILFGIVGLVLVVLYAPTLLPQLSELASTTTG